MTPPPIKFAVLVLMLLVLEQAFAECNDKTVWNMTADAYQYPQQSNPLTAYYKEWWFFTYSDEASDTAFCVGYSISDPKNTNKKASSGIAGMFWPNFHQNATDIQLLGDLFNVSDFSANTHNASVSIGNTNHIKVLSETSYSLIGATHDGLLKWDLVYEQEAGACREIFQVPFVELDWISYMPSAIVTGTVVYEGKTIPIKGKGYHDHNWGVWPTSYFNWVWAQYSDESQGFSMVMGAYRLYPSKEYIGYAFIRLDSTQLKLGTLCADYFNLTPEKFATWNGHQYSIQNHVELQSTAWRLEMDYAMVSSGVNPGGVGLDLLVFEQISQFNVTFSKASGKTWQPLVRSIGLGFNEWSDVLI